MSRPFITVVCPTMRMGGIDILLAGLANQTFKDFELVLVDGCHARRPAILERRLDRRVPGTFSITHVPPIGSEFPVAQFCRYSNTALIHARGEIVVFVVDYTWLPPDALATHAQWHREHPEKIDALMMPQDYRELPPLDPRWPNYGDQETARYAKDVEAGALDWASHSIFADPFPDSALSLPVHHKWGGADPKMKLQHTWAGSRINATNFHAKNESIKLSVLLEANGWDEDLDGTHCFQDSELAERLDMKHDVRFYMPDRSVVAEIVNPRTVFPFAERQRPVEENELLWNVKKGQGFAHPTNPDFNLLHERKKRGIACPT